MKNLFIFIIILKLISIFGDAYRILGVFPTVSKSHYIVGSALLKALAEKGHDVTVISPFPQKIAMKNYHDVNIEGVFEVTKDFISNILELKNMNIIKSFLLGFDTGIVLINSTLNEPNVRNLIKSNQKFDLVIIDVFLSKPLLGFGSLYNAPVIGLSTLGETFETTDLVGSPSPLSYVPNAFLPLTNRMNVLQRIQNIAITTLLNLYNTFYYFPKQVAIYNHIFPDPKPSLSELQKKVSLILLNTHVSMSYPRPYNPNMIEVGGMHIKRQTKPLPENIKKFIESSEYGVIYFSMGTNVKSNQLPIEKRQAILKAFATLKQKVLWKFEDTNLPGKSDNIMISDWFPQDDILAHPNVKIFITHGGLLSTNEAVYHGVPIIGIPIFGDQHLNMANAVQAGYGRLLDYNDLNEDRLKRCIYEVLQNRKYADNVKRISERYRDQPQTPLETAVYWVEYILRNEGAPHLRSAGIHLSFIEYHNIDAFLIFFIGIYLILYIFVKLVKSLCCSCCKGRKSKVISRRKLKIK